MTTTATAKSGLRVLKPGEVLFTDGEVAESLFIIQKGNIRLYKPKGKGFVEIAVLRSGEVIGEMAYFDEDGSGKKRSCSASAVGSVEIIEISFLAFGKTMQSLNPWFKTIITTLVGRLRKTNIRLKELEDNAALSYGKASGYEFMKPIEVMRILGTIFLVFKAHGEAQGQSLALHKKTLSLYTLDMYQIVEVKLESVLNLLVDLGLFEVQSDDDKLPNLYLLKNIESVRQIFIYYNSERHLPEDKKLRVSDKSEELMASILSAGQENIKDHPTARVDVDSPAKFTKMYELTNITDEPRAVSMEDCRNVGLFGELLVISGVHYIEIDFPKVQKLYPVIRFMNAVRKLNREKSNDV